MFLCTQHLRVSYSDILIMPTAERRFYLGMLVQARQKEKEAMENSNSSNSGSKGTRKTKVSGETLKSKIKSGQIPVV